MKKEELDLRVRGGWMEPWWLAPILLIAVLVFVGYMGIESGKYYTMLSSHNENWKVLVETVKRFPDGVKVAYSPADYPSDSLVIFSSDGRTVMVFHPDGSVTSSTSSSPAETK